jgi:uncharacterized damage-inducible protein DinB
MITPAWVRLMADYNAEMNRRLYAAAARLDEAERLRDRGAFFGSIHTTLAHLIWGDTTWMARLAGWPKPGPRPERGDAPAETFDALAARRADLDAGLIAWAAGLDAAALEGDLTWFSGATQREITRPRWLLVTHVFNHQTHHRGQAHAMLTAAGERTGDTDLPFILPPPPV